MMLRENGVRIGVAQMPMTWTVGQNLQTISGYIRRSYKLDVVIFPELALSGFHRNIKAESDKDTLKAAIQYLRVLAKKYQTALFLGAPQVSGAKIYNGYLCISADGEILAQWHKRGLTDSESQFFAQGGPRSVVTLNGTKCTTIICREVEDIDWFISQFRSGAPQLIVWPSYIRQAGNEQRQTGYFSAASEIAKRLGAFILQCNWPNALNDQSIQGLGASRVIAPDGECVIALPTDQAALGIVELKGGMLRPVEVSLSLGNGERRDCSRQVFFSS